MRAVVGIDPGVTGAIAVIHGGHLKAVYDMPVNDSRADASEIAAILNDISVASEIASVVIEDTQPMPKNGSIASFKLGYNTGVVVGVVQSLSHPLRRVRPVIWKRDSGLHGKDKAASRGLATELYPSHAGDFRMAKHDGRAEAALIARWGLAQLIKEGNSD